MTEYNSTEINREKQIINLIKQICGSQTASLIGDDCAYLQSKNLLVSADAMIEGVHFLPNIKPYYLGWKIAAINISDIAAMGAKPEYLLLTASLPAKIEISWIEEFIKGLNDCCLEFNVTLIGGDLTRADKICLSATILGSAWLELESAKYKTAHRFNAIAGQKILTTGSLGDSNIGLEILQSAKENLNEIEMKSNFADLVLAHLKPYPQVNSARQLWQLIKPETALCLMDSSDGLLDCLQQISEQSKVQMQVNLKQIPLSKELKQYMKLKDLNSAEIILNGGEDYQLIGTAFLKDELDLPEPWKIIGEVKAGSGIEIKDFEGNNLELKSLKKSFQHFN